MHPDRPGRRRPDPAATLSARAHGPHRAAVALVACAFAALAGCGGSGDEARDAQREANAEIDAAKREVADGMVHLDPLSFTDEGVRISRRGGPDALVTSNGSFLVDGKDVAVTPEQRAQLVKYHESAQALRKHAIETGLAGVEVAKTAVGEVLGGLVQGDTSRIRPNVESSAEGVKHAAYRLCGDLEAIRAVEESLAGLDAFARYRFVDREKIDDCRRDTAPAAASAAAASGPTAPATATPAGAPTRDSRAAARN